MVLLSRRVDYRGFWRAWMEFPMFSTWRWTLGNFGTGVRYTMTVVLSLGKWVLTLASSVPIVFSPRASRGCLISRPGTGVPEIKALGCLFSRPGSRFPEINSTRLRFFLCKAQGCLWSKAQGCLISRPGTRLTEVTGTRLLDFQIRHKVA